MSWLPGETASKLALWGNENFMHFDVFCLRMLSIESLFAGAGERTARVAGETALGGFDEARSSPWKRKLMSLPMHQHAYRNVAQYRRELNKDIWPRSGARNVELSRGGENYRGAGLCTCALRNGGRTRQRRRSGFLGPPAGKRIEISRGGAAQLSGENALSCFLVAWR